MIMQFPMDVELVWLENQEPELIPFSRTRSVIVQNMLDRVIKSAL